MYLIEKTLKKNFMTPFYGWGSTVSRLHSHYEKAVYWMSWNLSDQVRKDKRLSNLGPTQWILIWNT